MAEPSHPVGNAAPDPGPEVRPQHPRPAPVAPPAWPEPPNAWQRNSRGTALILLWLGLVVFVGAALLFSRLTTGTWFFVGLSQTPSDRVTTLGSLLLEPVSIYQAPLQAVVLALLLAMFVAGVILIAQFYGPAWSLLYVLAVMLVAHLPLLGAALVISGLLAASRWLGVRNRFIRGLAGLVPAIAAMWLSVAQTDVSDVLFKSPTERLFLHFPWLLAIALAIVTMLLFWTIAALLRYRCGVTLGLFAVMTAAAAGLFYYGVGMDELEFHLLDARCGLNSKQHFCPRSVKSQVKTQMDKWELLQGCDATDTPAEVQGRRDLAHSEVKKASASELIESRKQVHDDCRGFLRRFPDSQYVPYILFLDARSQDMRLDRQAIGAEEQLRFYEDQVSDEGLASWQQLYRNYRNHPLAIVARVRIAQHEMAVGQIDDALGRLKEARRLWEDYKSSYQPPGPSMPLLKIFDLNPHDPVSPQIIQERVAPVARWIWLIEQNRGAGATGDEPLAKWFQLDPRDDSYDRATDSYRNCYERLVSLRKQYASSRMADNFDLMIRLWKADPAQQNPTQRIDALRDFLTVYSRPADGDAHYEALAELAHLLIQGVAADQEQAVRIWNELKATGTPFADEARQNLNNLGREPPEPDH